MRCHASVGFQVQLHVTTGTCDHSGCRRWGLSGASPPLPVVPAIRCPGAITHAASKSRVHSLPYGTEAEGTPQLAHVTCMCACIHAKQHEATMCVTWRKLQTPGTAEEPRCVLQHYGQLKFPDSVHGCHVSAGMWQVMAQRHVLVQAAVTTQLCHHTCHLPQRQRDGQPNQPPRPRDYQSPQPE